MASLNEPMAVSRHAVNRSEAKPGDKVVVIAEALTNAAKHSGSDRAEIVLARYPTGLGVRVRDEGCGGADESAGSGLPGMRRRVAALDGTVQVTSPLGGPTVIEVHLPCV